MKNRVIKAHQETNSVCLNLNLLNHAIMLIAIPK